MAFTEAKLKGSTHIWMSSVHLPHEQRQKLDDKAKRLYFVGYSEQSKAFRLLDKETSKIIISRDVIFLEDNQSQEEPEDTKESLEIKIDVSDKDKNEDAEIATDEETQMDQ